MVRLLAPLLAAFKLWLFIDARKRRAPDYWQYVIWLPFGAVAYFFMVKIHDYRGTAVWRLLSFDKPVTLDQLRLLYRTSPSLENQMNLAQRLYDDEHFREAAECFQQGVERHTENLDLRYGLGMSLLAVDDFEPAIEHLTAVIQQEPGYEEYEAWLKLAVAYHESGQKQECLRELRRLVEHSPRLKHQVHLAHFLNLAGKRAEARDVLSEALVHHDTAPTFLKKRNRAWARKAREMLKELEVP
jgi:hypothetical protein